MVMSFRSECSQEGSGLGRYSFFLTLTITPWNFFFPVKIKKIKLYREALFKYPRSSNNSQDIIIKNVLYQSRAYASTFNEKSFTVKIKQKNSFLFGLIEYFFFFENVNYICITLLDSVKETFLYSFKGNTSKT